MTDKECKPNYKYACEKADKQMWLHNHQKNMTNEEHKEYWDLVRAILYAETDMDVLYDKIKKRVGE